MASGLYVFHMNPWKQLTPSMNITCLGQNVDAGGFTAFTEAEAEETKGSRITLTYNCPLSTHSGAAPAPGFLKVKPVGPNLQGQA